MSLMRVILPAAAIVAIGGGIGLADWAMRNDRVSLGRKNLPPPPVEVVPKPPDVAAEKPTEAVTAPPVTPSGNGSPSDVTTQQPSPEQPRATAMPSTELPAGHITIAQARSLFDQNSIFVDARRKEVYAEGHVAGSFRADMASFKTGDPAWVSAFPKDLTLVVYCNGGDCDESEHVAQLLEASGFQTIYVMHDGFPGWKAAGHPIETGEGQE